MTEPSEKFVGVDESYRPEVRDTTNPEKVPQVSMTIGGFAREYRLERKSDFLDQGQKARVLMLGSGYGDLLTDLRDNFPDAEFVDLNPVFADTKFDKGLRENAVAAFNPELPFTAGSFDRVVDRMASIWYSYGDGKKMAERTNEIMRVLKDRGKAFIGPVPGRAKEDFVAELKSLGILDEGFDAGKLNTNLVITKENGKIRFE